MNVRICKGIYVEPRRIAWKGHETIIGSFAAMVEKHLSAGCYAAIATHDEECVEKALATIDRLKLRPDQYEFQMLLGVDPLLRKALIDAGHRLRVYVPFGKDWYAYSVRRLKENPSIARHVIRRIVGLGPGELGARSGGSRRSSPWPPRPASSPPPRPPDRGIRSSPPRGSRPASSWSPPGASPSPSPPR